MTIISKTNNYKHIKDRINGSTVNIIKITKDKIDRFDIIPSTNKKPIETIKSFYNKHKPDVICNGSLFAMNTGFPSSVYRTNGKSYGDNGFYYAGLILYQLNKKFGIKQLSTFNELSQFNVGVEGLSLVIDGKKDIRSKGLDSGFLNNKANRTVIGFDDEHFYIITIDGRMKNELGMNASQCADMCLTLGIQNAILLDGGGSTRCMIGEKVINKPTENRPVNNAIGIWFLDNKQQNNKKEDGIMSKKKVCLDAGHGGKDPGAVGQSGLREKDVVLKITKLIEDNLKFNNIEVIMTRTTDIALGSTISQDLSNRAKIANDNKVDIFVSIHNNAATDKKARGIETFSYRENTNGHNLSKIIQDNLIKDTQLVNRGVKTENFAVLRQTNMAASLVEVCFISNNEEEKLLNDNSFIEKSANSISKSICEYFGINYKSNQPTQPTQNNNPTIKKRVKAKELNVRSEPNLTCQVLGQYISGNEVWGKVYNDQWFEIEYFNSRKAFLYLPYLEDIEVEFKIEPKKEVKPEPKIEPIPQPIATDENIADSWKLDGLKYLSDNGLLNDFDTWKEKKDEPASVWFVATLLKRIHESVKK